MGKLAAGRWGHGLWWDGAGGTWPCTYISSALTSGKGSGGWARVEAPEAHARPAALRGRRGVLFRPTCSFQWLARTRGGWDSETRGRRDVGTWVRGAGDVGTRRCRDVGMQSASFPFVTFLHRLVETVTGSLRGTGACSSRGVTGRTVASPPASRLCLREPAVVWFGWALPFFDSHIWIIIKTNFP